MNRRQRTLKRRQTLFKRNEIRQRFGASGGGDLPWQTFVGNPLQFNAPKAHTLKSVKASFSPVQDLHGYANPWPAGGNVNKYNEATVTFGKWTASDGTVDDAQYGCISVEIQTDGRTSCRVKPFGSVSPYSYSIIEFASDDSFIRRDHSTSSSGYVFTLAGNTSYIKLQVACQTNETLTAEKLASYMMLLSFEATTPASYSPYSNECPITGWTGANVWDAGENLWNMNDPSAEHGYYGTNGQFTATEAFRCIAFACSEGDTFTKSGTGWGGINTYWNGDTFVSGNNSSTVTIPSGVNRVKFACQVSATAPMLNIGLTAKPYSPYVGQPLSVTWSDEAGTVYGGYAEVAEDGSGQGSDEWAKTELNADGWWWQKGGTQPSGLSVFTTTNFPTAKGSSQTGYKELCTQFGNSGVQYVSQMENNTFFLDTYSGRAFFCWGGSSDVTLDEFKAFIRQQKADGTPVEVAYFRATPVPFTPTVTGQPTAVQGINTIWSDANGDVTAVARGEAVNLSALQSLNMLLGGRYYNNGTADEPTDEEALRILMGGER